MAEGAIFVALDPIYGRSYGMADRLDHGEATIVTPVEELVAGVLYQAELRDVVPPGARMLRVRGWFSDSGGIQEELGVWTYGASEQGTGSGAVALQTWEVCEPVLPLAPLVSNGADAFNDYNGRVRWGGAAGALIGGAVPDLFHATVEWEMVSGVRCGCFADTADGDVPPNIPALLDREIKRLETQGTGMARVGIVSATQPLDIQRVCGAYPRGDNNYFVLAGDVGNSDWQIPAPDPAGNTVDKFRNHPSVFLRAQPSIRGFHHPARYPYDVGVITAPPPSISGVQLRTVDRAPTHSRWLLRIDSELLDVIIAHPAGSNYRRPRDIWNNVIAPLLGTAGGIPGTLPLYDAEINGAVRTFNQVGTLRGTHYIQGATFWEPLDGDTAPITTLIPQTGAPT
jgi:hypothetical protein